MFWFYTKKQIDEMLSIDRYLGVEVDKAMLRELEYLESCVKKLEQEKAAGWKQCEHEYKATEWKGAAPSGLNKDDVERWEQEQKQNIRKEEHLK